MSDDIQPNIEPVHETEVLMAMHERETQEIHELAHAVFTANALALVIEKANKITEDSYDQETRRYTIDLRQALTIACQQEALPQMARLLYLAMASYGNDTIEWAEVVLGRELDA